VSTNFRNSSSSSAVHLDEVAVVFIADTLMGSQMICNRPATLDYS
jgi:hypothetical protein